MADNVCALVVNNDGQVLQIERIDGTGWAFPGGKIEDGESKKTACLRELQEETGISADNLKEEFSLYLENGCYCFGFLYDGNGDIFPQESEAIGAGWFYPSELPKPQAFDVQMALTRLTADSTYKIAELMAEGKLTSPQATESTHLFSMRMTGTGLSKRHSPNGRLKYVFRNPETYASDEALKEFIGVPVVLGHSKDKNLSDGEYRQKVIGSVVLPFVKDAYKTEEGNMIPKSVWAICRIEQAIQAELLENKELSTSPGATSFKKKYIKDGMELSEEEYPAHIDHLAIVPRGVWDHQGKASGVDSQGTKKMHKKIRNTFAPLKGGVDDNVLHTETDADTEGDGVNLSEADKMLAKGIFMKMRANNHTPEKIWEEIAKVVGVPNDTAQDIVYQLSDNKELDAEADPMADYEEGVACAKKRFEKGDKAETIREDLKKEFPHWTESAIIKAVQEGDAEASGYEGKFRKDNPQLVKKGEDEEALDKLFDNDSYPHTKEGKAKEHREDAKEDLKKHERAKHHPEEVPESERTKALKKEILKRREDDKSEYRKEKEKKAEGKGTDKDAINDAEEAIAGYWASVIDTLQNEGLSVGDDLPGDMLEHVYDLMSQHGLGMDQATGEMYLLEGDDGDGVLDKEHDVELSDKQKEELRKKGIGSVRGKLHGYGSKKSSSERRLGKDKHGRTINSAIAAKGSDLTDEQKRKAFHSEQSTYKLGNKFKKGGDEERALKDFHKASEHYIPKGLREASKRSAEKAIERQRKLGQLSRRELHHTAAQHHTRGGWDHTALGKGGSGGGEEHDAEKKENKMKEKALRTAHTMFEKGLSAADIEATLIDLYEDDIPEDQIENMLEPFYSQEEHDAEETKREEERKRHEKELSELNAKIEKATKKVDKLNEEEEPLSAKDEREIAEMRSRVDAIKNDLGEKRIPFNKGDNKDAYVLRAGNDLKRFNPRFKDVDLDSLPATAREGIFETILDSADKAAKKSLTDAGKSGGRWRKEKHGTADRFIPIGRFEDINAGYCL